MNIRANLSHQFQAISLNPKYLQFLASNKPDTELSHVPTLGPLGCLPHTGFKQLLPANVMKEYLHIICISTMEQNLNNLGRHAFRTNNKELT